MPESHASRGARRGRRLLHDLGVEIRAARRSSGLSQAAVATAAGMSSSELSRIEHGDAPWLDVISASRICAVVGLDLWFRAFPGPTPVRDGAHLRLISAFRAQLGAGLVVRTEVPVGHPRDLRAWDLTATDRHDTAAAEFETRVTDAQALARRVTLKCRDSGIAIVILVVSETAHNRHAVAASRAYLRPLFPLDSSAILKALRDGRVPDSGGILFLRNHPRTGGCPYCGRCSGRSLNRPALSRDAGTTGATTNGLPGGRATNGVAATSINAAPVPRAAPRTPGPPAPRTTADQPRTTTTSDDPAATRDDPAATRD